MARNSGLSYQVSRNSSANDWYWEVMYDRKIIDRGLAPTRAEARAQALKVARSYLVQENSMPSFEGSQGYSGTLKTTTPRSSTTEM
jgi:hypothetical protein